MNDQEFLPFSYDVFLFQKADMKLETSVTVSNIASNGLESDFKSYSIDSPTKH